MFTLENVLFTIKFKGSVEINLDKIVDRNFEEENTHISSEKRFEFKSFLFGTANNW